MDDAAPVFAFSARSASRFERLFSHSLVRGQQAVDELPECGWLWRFADWQVFCIARLAAFPVMPLEFPVKLSRIVVVVRGVRRRAKQLRPVNGSLLVHREEVNQIAGKTSCRER